MIGPANCAHVVGWSWRYTRDWARAHGVTILRLGGAAKPLIRWSELAAAIDREARRAQPPAPLTETQELEVARAALAR